ncbi:MAG TPA: type VI secretion system baseplate subunit TssG [Verrucomicrobiales bacterium]|nr:type VI secretion system baseplate subunit TssG [Verrucomicrobiales bacterium]
MAGPAGNPPRPVIDEIAANPPGFDFFAAIRRVQAEFSDRPRIGCSLRPSGDPIRFAQTPALDFAPSTLESLQVSADDPTRPPTLFARHFGVFGPNGALPLCLTEYARDRIYHHGDRTFAAFCNVFHHRLMSLFFRAWAESNKAVDMDRPGDSHWVHYLGALFGLSGEAFWNRDSVPDRAKLYFSGRLVAQSRNAEGLAAIVRDFFNVDTELVPFVGRWMNLPDEYQWKLGDSRDTGSLGRTTIVGSRVWAGQLHFRLRLGPMRLVDLERMLPSGGSFRRLRDWVRLYTTDQFTWDVQMILAREEVPAVQLGKSGRVGWTTWLKTKPFDHDAEDIIVNPEAAG